MTVSPSVPVLSRIAISSLVLSWADPQRSMRSRGCSSTGISRTPLVRPTWPPIDIEPLPNRAGIVAAKSPVRTPKLNEPAKARMVFSQVDRTAKHQVSFDCRSTQRQSTIPPFDSGEMTLVLGRLFKRRAEPDPQLEQALAKTRKSVFSEISRLFDRETIDDELYEDLEMLLIQADVGWDVTQQLIQSMRRKIAEGRIIDPSYAREILRWDMVELLEDATRNRQVKILQRGVPYVIMVVGVNGVGKTTSIAKLAAYHKGFGRSVMLAAGDTFRAAAIDQLKIWGDRLEVPVVAHEPGADPGAVVFDAMQAAYARDRDVLIVDTAGRLHTKFNLMEELKKLRKIMQKHVEEAPRRRPCRSRSGSPRPCLAP